MAKYKCRYRHMTDEQLRNAQVSQGLLLDRLFGSRDRTDKLQIGNARRRYWRIMDEQDRRRSTKTDEKERRKDHDD